jgi:hypothetical protein
MKNCENNKILIEKYLDGMITDDERNQLQKHVEECSSCRSEFERSTLLKDTVKQAFSSHTTAEEGGASLVARLSTESDIKSFHNPAIPVFTGKRAAVAAVICLATGVLLGFALDRGDEATEAMLNLVVPIQVGKIEGTVLVKHESCDIWQALETGSKIRLGDTFHSATKSTCVLELDPNSTIELNQNSMLVLNSYNGKTEFNLEHGELTADLESPHGPFFISTPHGRVEALGTEFTVKVTDE